MHTKDCMNQRIKELIAECTTVENGVMQVRRNETVYHFDKVKFAELIVKECAEQVKNLWVDDYGTSGAGYDSGEESAQKELAAAIAKIARLTKRKDECSNGWDEALAQRDKARNDALEEAAAICDSESTCEGIAQKCAAEIRAMKGCGK